MDYLQYVDILKTVTGVRLYVLNLVINGLPSICNYGDKVEMEEKVYKF